MARFQMSSAHIKGLLAEQVALLFLRLKGYRILRRNEKAGGAEVDIIAKHKNTLCLIEVKWRQDQAKAHQALTPKQQERLKWQCGYWQRHYQPAGGVRLEGVLLNPHWPFVEHHKTLPIVA